MEDRVVKEALSYALGSDIHEAWRATRKREDGTFEPRIKKSKDEAWNEAHGTDEVDIANCSFNELPSSLIEKQFLFALRILDLILYAYFSLLIVLPIITKLLNSKLSLIFINISP